MLNVTFPFTFTVVANELLAIVNEDDGERYKRLCKRRDDREINDELNR
jgi:hypothetical protein